MRHEADQDMPAERSATVRDIADGLSQSQGGDLRLTMAAFSGGISSSSSGFTTKYWSTGDSKQTYTTRSQSRSVSTTSDEVSFVERLLPLTSKALCDCAYHDAE
jgi:hypothetical protein